MLEGALYFGNGVPNKSYSPAASLDVVGHEYTHAVTQTESGLVRKGESGALNESLSDIFGCFIEHHFCPDGSAAPPCPGTTNNVLYGENASLDGHTPYRSMSHPKESPYGRQPDNYMNLNAPNDNPHTNSGISNNAWYLMTFGGRNDSSPYILIEPGMGWNTSLKLWWALQTEGLKARDGFRQAALAMLALATKGGFDDGTRKAAACAWVATGVLTAQEVTDNWHICCWGHESCADGGSDRGGTGADSRPRPREAGTICGAATQEVWTYKCPCDSASYCFEGFCFNYGGPQLSGVCYSYESTPFYPYGSGWMVRYCHSPDTCCTGGPNPNTVDGKSHYCVSPGCPCP